MGEVEQLEKKLGADWTHLRAAREESAQMRAALKRAVQDLDKRKPAGRTVKELARVFEQLPEASFCFDIGHARQVDPTMTEARLILREFGTRLRQVHVSEVNTRSKHDRLSYVSMLGFQDVAHLIPAHVPLILETPVLETEMEVEIARVREALPVIRIAA